MSVFTPSLENLIEHLAQFPGIGRKSAQRLAFHVLRLPRDAVVDLAKALVKAKESVAPCSICFNLTEVDPCRICSDNKRDRSTICVVEEAGDVLALEKTESYRGLYHVLGGALSPLDGIGPENLRIKELIVRLDGVKEVILCTNPSLEGETTVLYLTDVLKSRGVLVTRIARGVPMGSVLEHADQVTLTRALEGRQTVARTSSGRVEEGSGS